MARWKGGKMAEKFGMLNANEELKTIPKSDYRRR